MYNNIQIVFFLLVLLQIRQRGWEQRLVDGHRRPLERDHHEDLRHHLRAGSQTSNGIEAVRQKEKLGENRTEY